MVLLALTGAALVQLDDMSQAGDSGPQDGAYCRSEPLQTTKNLIVSGIKNL